MGKVTFYLDLDLTGASTATPNVPTLSSRLPQDYSANENVILEINLTEEQARIFQFRSKNNVTGWSDDLADDLMFRYTPADNSQYLHTSQGNEINPTANPSPNRPKNWPVFLNHWHNWRDVSNSKLHSSNERLDQALANRMAKIVFGHKLSYDIFNNERQIANKCGMSINNALKQIRSKISTGYANLGEANGSPKDSTDNVFVAPFNDPDEDNDNNIPQYILSRILHSEPMRFHSTNLSSPYNLNSSYGDVNCFTIGSDYSEWVDVPLCAGDEILINMTSSVTFTNPLTNVGNIKITTHLNNGDPVTQPAENQQTKGNQAVVKINIVKYDETASANHARIEDFDSRENASDWNGHGPDTYYHRNMTLSSFVGPYSLMSLDPLHMDNEIVFRTSRAAEQYTNPSSTNNGVDVGTTTVAGRTYYIPNSYGKDDFADFEHIDNDGGVDEKDPSYVSFKFLNATQYSHDSNIYKGARSETSATLNTISNTVNFELKFNEPIDLNKNGSGGQHDPSFSEIFFKNNAGDPLRGDDSDPKLDIINNGSSDGGITWLGTFKTHTNTTTMESTPIFIQNFRDLAGNPENLSDSAPYNTMAIIYIDMHSHTISEFKLVNNGNVDLTNNYFIDQNLTGAKLAYKIEESINNSMTVELELRMKNESNNNYEIIGSGYSQFQAGTSSDPVQYIDVTNITFTNGGAFTSLLENSPTNNNKKCRLLIKVQDTGGNILISTYDFILDYLTPAVLRDTFTTDVLTTYGGIYYLNIDKSNTFSFELESNHGGSDADSIHTALSYFKIIRNSDTHNVISKNLSSGNNVIDNTMISLDQLINGVEYHHEVRFADTALQTSALTDYTIGNEQSGISFIVDRDSATATSIELDVDNTKVNITYDKIIKSAGLIADWDVQGDAIGQYSVVGVSISSPQVVTLSLDKPIISDCTFVYSGSSVLCKAGNSVNHITQHIIVNAIDQTNSEITLNDLTHVLTMKTIHDHQIQMTDETKNNAVETTEQVINLPIISYTIKNDGTTRNMGNVQLKLTNNRKTLEFHLPETIQGSGGMVDTTSKHIDTISFDFTSGDLKKLGGDGDGNILVDSFTHAVSDTTVPIVSIDAVGTRLNDAAFTINNTTTNDDKIALTFNFLEEAFDSSSFTAGDITVSNNAEITDFAINGNTATAKLGLTDTSTAENGEQTLTVFVGSNTFNDTGGNENDSPSNTITWKCNKKKPTMVITATDSTDSSVSHGQSINNESVTVIFTMDFTNTLPPENENDYNFDTSDIEITNGTLTGLTKNTATEWSATLTTTNSSGYSQTKIKVKADGFNDLYGNGSVESNEFMWISDTHNPLITIVNSKGVHTGDSTSDPNGDDAIEDGDVTTRTENIRFRFSTESGVEDFTISDLSLVNLTIKDNSFSAVSLGNDVGNTMYEVILNVDTTGGNDPTTTPINCSIHVPPNSITDENGLTNVSSMDFSFTCDKVPPVPVDISDIHIKNQWQQDQDISNNSVSDNLGNHQYYIFSMNRWIFFHVVYDKPVRVTGTPLLYFNDIATPAEYQSGSSTNSIKFGYDPNTTDDTEHLDISSVSIDLNGGKIEDVIDNNSNYNQPYNLHKTNAILDLSPLLNDNTKNPFIDTHIKIDNTSPSAGNFTESSITIPWLSGAPENVLNRAKVNQMENDSALRTLTFDADDLLSVSDNNLSDGYDVYFFGARTHNDISYSTNTIELPMSKMTQMLNANTEGSEEIKMWLEDKIGNARSVIKNFTVNLSQPVLTLEGEVGGNNFTNLVNPTCEISSDKDITVSVKEVTTKPTDCSGVEISGQVIAANNHTVATFKNSDPSNPDLPDGNYVIILEGTDTTSLNKSSNTLTISFEIITVAPSITVRTGWKHGAYDMSNNYRVDPTMSSHDEYFNIQINDIQNTSQDFVNISFLMSHYDVQTGFDKTYSEILRSNVSSTIIKFGGRYGNYELLDPSIDRFLNNIEGTSGNIIITATDLAGNQSVTTHVVTSNHVLPVVSFTPNEIHSNTFVSNTINMNLNEDCYVKIKPNGYLNCKVVINGQANSTVVGEEELALGTLSAGDNTIELTNLVNDNHDDFQGHTHTTVFFEIISKNTGNYAIDDGAGLQYNIFIREDDTYDVALNTIRIKGNVGEFMMGNSNDNIITAEGKIYNHITDSISTGMDGTTANLIVTDPNGLQVMQKQTTVIGDTVTFDISESEFIESSFPMGSITTAIFTFDLNNDVYNNSNSTDVSYELNRAMPFFSLSNTSMGSGNIMLIRDLDDETPPYINLKFTDINLSTEQQNNPNLKMYVQIRKGPVTTQAIRNDNQDANKTYALNVQMITNMNVPVISKELYNNIINNELILDISEQGYDFKPDAEISHGSVTLDDVEIVCRIADISGLIYTSMVIDESNNKYHIPTTDGRAHSGQIYKTFQINRTITNVKMYMVKDNDDDNDYYDALINQLDVSNNVGYDICVEVYTPPGETLANELNKNLVKDDFVLSNPSACSLGDVQIIENYRKFKVRIIPNSGEHTTTIKLKDNIQNFLRTNDFTSTPVREGNFVTTNVNIYPFTIAGVSPFTALNVTIDTNPPIIDVNNVVATSRLIVQTTNVSGVPEWTKVENIIILPTNENNLSSEDLWVGGKIMVTSDDGYHENTDFLSDISGNDVIISINTNANDWQQNHIFKNYDVSLNINADSFKDITNNYNDAHSNISVTNQHLFDNVHPGIERVSFPSHTTNFVMIKYNGDIPLYPQHNIWWTPGMRIAIPGMGDINVGGLYPHNDSGANYHDLSFNEYLYTMDNTVYDSYIDSNVTIHFEESRGGLANSSGIITNMPEPQTITVTPYNGQVGKVSTRRVENITADISGIFMAPWSNDYMNQHNNLFDTMLCIKYPHSNLSEEELSDDHPPFNMYRSTTSFGDVISKRPPDIYKWASYEEEEKYYDPTAYGGYGAWVVTNPGTQDNTINTNVVITCTNRQDVSFNAILMSTPYYQQYMVNTYVDIGYVDFADGVSDTLPDSQRNLLTISITPEVYNDDDITLTVANREIVKKTQVAGYWTVDIHEPVMGFSNAKVQTNVKDVSGNFILSNSPTYELLYNATVASKYDNKLIISFSSNISLNTSTYSTDFILSDPNSTQFSVENAVVDSSQIILTLNKESGNQPLEPGTQNVEISILEDSLQNPANIHKTMVARMNIPINTNYALTAKNATTNEYNNFSTADVSYNLAVTSFNTATTNFNTADNSLNLVNQALTDASTNLVTAINSFNTADQALTDASTNLAVADASLNAANTVLSSAQTTFDDASANFAIADNSFNLANNSFIAANTAFEDASTNLAVVDNSLNLANQAFEDASTNLAVADNSLNLANQALTDASANFAVADNSLNLANQAFTDASANFAVADNSFNLANTAFTDASANFAVADNSFNLANQALTDASTNLAIADNSLNLANQAFEDASANFAVADNSLNLANQAFEDASANFAVADNSFNTAVIDYSNGTITLEQFNDASTNLIDATASFNSAETAKTNAETAKSTAETAKNDAEAAKTTAETAKITAETAKATAETDKATAETAKTNAETAKATAETAKNDAEAAKTTAETAKATAETAKTSAETDKANAQTTFNDADSAKTAAETAKATAETNKANAETTKTNAETAQVAATTAKTTAETEKTTAQTAKDDAETAKDDAETAKTAAETAKTAAQATKDDAETSQVAATTAKSTAQTAKDDAETAKTTAETAKTTAEQAIAPAETAKTTAQGVLTAAQTVKDNAETAKNTANSTYTTAYDIAYEAAQQ
jgi:hypothetical protein